MLLPMYPVADLIANWHLDDLRNLKYFMNLDEHFPQTGRSHDRSLVKACLTAN